MRNKILIIGGVAGGATAAARARRLDESAEIILIERGSYISFANCGLPYYIGNVIKDRNELFVTTPEDFSLRYHIDIRTLTEAVSINRTEKTIELKNKQTGEIYKETYGRLILSTGAEPIHPPIKGIESEGIFNLRDVPDTDRIKSWIDLNKPETAIVVGGGFIGLEMAENLVHRGVQTIVVEMADQVMTTLDFEMAGLIHAHLRDKGVSLELGSSVTAFSNKNSRILVTLSNQKQVECDLVIMSTGIKPENRLAREAGLAIGARGGIRVNAAMQTNDPNIYAVGDVAEVVDFVTGLPTMTPLAGPANKQGRIAADNALGRKSLFRGTLGTSVVKVFDFTVAATGASEKALKAAGIPHMVSHTHSGSHASYYPGARIMAIKLIFSAGSGRVLGAQVVGSEGVDKRIDVLATAIKGGMTVYDLEELELAYAPPFSSAKDPVNIAGFVGANILKGDMEMITWDKLPTLDRENNIIMDLRNKDELEESGEIPGAIHIPVNSLRDRLESLDRTKTYITFCAVGLRAYLAYRILVQNGFQAKVLGGGFMTLLGAREIIMSPSSKTRLWISE